MTAHRSQPELKPFFSLSQSQTGNAHFSSPRVFNVTPLLLHKTERLRLPSRYPLISGPGTVVGLKYDDIGGALTGECAEFLNNPSLPQRQGLSIEDGDVFRGSGRNERPHRQRCAGMSSFYPFPSHTHTHTYLSLSSFHTLGGHAANDFNHQKKDPSNDPNIGSARGNNKSSTSDALQTVGITASTSGMALLSTFLPAFILAVVCFLIFLICRRTQRRFYSPRSYLGHMHDQYVVILTSGGGGCGRRCYI